ncbi:MAG: hypothetical protein R3F56_07140 [Planctomycetota bacterium]
MSGNREGSQRRRTLVVNGPLQRAFVVDVSFVPTVAMGITTMIVAALCQRVNNEAAAADVELASLVPLFTAFALFVFASGGAVVLQALKISNRIAGPQVNMRRVVDRVLAGEHDQRVHLREGDFMMSAAEDINRLIAHFTADSATAAVSQTTGADVDDVAAPPVAAPDVAAVDGATVNGATVDR